MTVWLFGWSRYEYEVFRPLSDFPLAHEEEGKGRGEVPEKIWSRMDMARMRKEDEASRIMRVRRKKGQRPVGGSNAAESHGSIMDERHFPFFTRASSDY